MRRIIISCFFVTLLPLLVLGGETEIEVLQGKVRGQTGQTDMMISAGQKGLVREGQEPIIAVNDPLVQKAIELYRWVEAERKAGHAVEEAMILIAAIDDEQVMRCAGLMETINDGSETKSVLQFGNASIFEDLKIYDFEGNLLDYEVKPVSEYVANYFIHLHKPVEPGKKIRFIAVSPSIKHLFWLTEGPIWSTGFFDSSTLKAKLFLYHIILPKSAILLGTYPEVLLTDKVEDRIALTFRRFIEEPSGYMCLGISFLWPDKDGTTMEDVPPEMRGLQDQKQSRVIEDSNKQLARIIEGQRFTDLTTPMNSLLTSVSFLFNDLDSLDKIDSSNPFIKKAFKGNLEHAQKQFIHFKKGLPYLEVHSYSPFPDEPKQGDTAWIKLKFKGTFKPIVTTEYAYMGNGQWLLQGGDFFTPPESSDEVIATVPDYRALYAPTPQELARGFEAVQGSGPESDPRLNKLEVDLGRQERDLVPITIAGLSEPDTISLHVTGPGAKLCKVLLEKDYQLHPGMQAALDINSPTRFWLEFNSSNFDHGSYDLMVRLSSSHGTELEIPGTVTIHDVALPQRRTIRMKPFSCVFGLSGADIHKPETRKRLEVFLDDLAALRNTVCDWVYTYNPANVLHQVKIAGTDQTLHAAGQAGIIDINNLPDLDFSFFDPWIAGSAKHGMTHLEITVRLYITEHERAFVKGVLGNAIVCTDEISWKTLMWLYSQFRDYVQSRGMTETWAIIDTTLEPDMIPDYVQTARRYQEIGYRTYTANIDGFARNATWFNQLNAQSDSWYMSYWQIQAFLALTSKAWEYEKRQETVGTQWAPYDNGGAVSTWCTPKPFFSEDIVNQIQDVVVSVNGKPLERRSGSGWANKERGVYMHWGPYLYVCLPDGNVQCQL